MAWSAGWVPKLLIVMGFILLWVRWRWLPSVTDRAYPKPPLRLLKPHTPDDCPEYRAAQPIRPSSATLSIPYSCVKGLRGRKKRIATAGYACPNSNSTKTGMIG